MPRSMKAPLDAHAAPALGLDVLQDGMPNIHNRGNLGCQQLIDQVLQGCSTFEFPSTTVPQKPSPNAAAHVSCTLPTRFRYLLSPAVAVRFHHYLTLNWQLQLSLI